MLNMKICLVWIKTELHCTTLPWPSVLTLSHNLTIFKGSTVKCTIKKHTYKMSSPQKDKMNELNNDDDTDRCQKQDASHVTMIKRADHNIESSIEDEENSG